MKKVVLMACLVIVLFTGCGMTEEQSNCKHEWHIVNEQYDNFNNKFYTIYCPKCKLEERRVYEKTWKELQLDMEYQKEHKINESEVK